MRAEFTSTVSLKPEVQHHLEVYLEMATFISLKILPFTDKTLGPNRRMLPLRKYCVPLALCEREDPGSFTSLLTMQDHALPTRLGYRTLSVSSLQTLTGLRYVKLALEDSKSR